MASMDSPAAAAWGGSPMAMGEVLGPVLFDATMTLGNPARCTTTDGVDAEYWLVGTACVGGDVGSGARCGGA